MTLHTSIVTLRIHWDDDTDNDPGPGTGWTSWTTRWPSACW